MNPRIKSYIYLHIAVLLYGLTAILGDLISISAVALVWWRVLITSVSLLFFVGLGRQILAMKARTVILFSGIGFLVGLHWITFYGAIKMSNASVVLAAMASTSLFTSFIEPLVTRKKIKKLEVFLGLMIIPPMLIIANTIDFDMKRGLWIALLSAFLASLFASLNKKYVELANSYQISFIEMSSAFILVSLILPFSLESSAELMPGVKDWIYLIILSLVCTSFAYVISMKALKHVSAFDANLVINLEPVYGILLAIVILKEHKEMSLIFYSALLLIMIIVFLHPYLEKRFYGRKDSNENNA